jgi:hypothetical protein
MPNPPQPQPWFPPDWTGWHYPDPNHPSTQQFPNWAKSRTIPCTLCGAPPGARCVTKNGDLYGVHARRSRKVHNPTDV